MKPLKKYLLLPGMLILISAFQAYSQSAQLQREIRIAESIIEEIFSDLPLPENEIVHAGSSVRVHSEYIPGAGVHFMTNRNFGTSIAGIHVGESGVRITTSRDTDQNKGHEEAAITAEDIEERMTEYLLNYSAQLQSLESDEVIRLSFGVARGQRNVFNRVFGTNQNERSELPALSMWITADEARKLRDGEISEQQMKSLIKRMDIAKTDIPRDITIFSSILETAIDNSDIPGLRLSGDVNASYIPGWGAEYNLTVRPVTAVGIFFSDGFTISDEAMEDIRASMQAVREDLEKGREEIRRSRILNKNIRADLDSAYEELRITMNSDSLNLFDTTSVQFSNPFHSSVSEQRQSPVSDEDIIASRELIEELVVSTISDYGSTLSSLNSNEFLKVTLIWRGRNDILPEETQFYIKKSDLERHRDVTVTSKPRS